MLMWKCDVCGEIGESPTSLAHMRLMPKGWRQREGSDKDNNGIQIHTCSAECAKKYDLAEVEQIGFVWQEPTSDGTLKEAKKRAGRRSGLPLKVQT